MKKTVSVPGKSLNYYSIASTASSFTASLQPSQFTALANVASGFEWYRFVKVRAKVVPPNIPASSFSVTGGDVFAFGYYPEETKATSTTVPVQAVASLKTSTIMKANQVLSAATNTGTTTCQVLNVSRKTLLATPVKWYKTGAASSENAEIQQGTFIGAIGVNPFSTMDVVVQYEFICEFAGPVDATILV